LLAAAGLAALAFGLWVPTVGATDKTVTIRGFEFRPSTITIVAGDTVTWVNRDTVDHTATAANGSFDTGLIGEDRSRSVRFTVAGRYRYVCTPHPSMTATVVVRAAGLTPPATDTAIDDGRDVSVGPLILIAALAAWIGVERRRFRRQTTPRVET
jgi:plastocyanin